MIYRSNLTCPDLTPHFKHLVLRPMPHSFGHSVPSDWGDKADDDPVFGLYKKCGFWTHDEAAILYNIAYNARGGPWADIGCHTGWTTGHIMLGVCNGSANMPNLQAVDPMLAVPEFRARLNENEGALGQGWSLNPVTSAEFWATSKYVTSAVIDGDYEPGKPLEDAKAWAAHTRDSVYHWRGVALFHDFLGRPVQEAVEYLLHEGFHARIYITPHMVACCWRGDFKPPDHIPDPNLPNLKARCPEFPWERTE